MYDSEFGLPEVVMMVLLFLFLFVVTGGFESMVNSMKRRWNNSSFITKRILTWIAIPIYIFIMIYAFIPR